MLGEHSRKEQIDAVSRGWDMKAAGELTPTLVSWKLIEWIEVENSVHLHIARSVDHNFPFLAGKQNFHSAGSEWVQIRTELFTSSNGRSLAEDATLHSSHSSIPTWSDDVYVSLPFLLARCRQQWKYCASPSEPIKRLTLIVRDVDWWVRVLVEQKWGPNQCSWSCIILSNHWCPPKSRKVHSAVSLSTNVL